MISFGYSEEQRPVLWFRGYPLYAVHVIVLVFVISMITTALLMAMGGDAILSGLVFSSQSVLRGEVWRAITYGLVNRPSLWFVIDMFMIIWFGRELEKMLGRRSFLSFFGLAYLLTPVVTTIMGLWMPISYSGQRSGFTLFIAFATFYPNMMFFFNIMAKWLAVVLVALYSLIAISQRDIVSLVSLWALTAFAFLYVRFHQGQLKLPRFPRHSNTPGLRVMEGGSETKKSTGAAASKKQTSMAEVDALLDKIAQYGIGSLTAQERAKLDAARDLIRRASRPE